MIVMANIDGVISDFVIAYLDTLYELEGLRFVRDDVDNWSFTKALGITSEQDARVWASSVLHDHMEDAAVLPGGLRALRAHYAAGDTVHFATARGTGANGQAAAQMKAERSFTADYLARHGLMGPGATLDFTGDKVAKSREVGADLCYEDAPHNALDLAGAGFRTVMPSFRYNDCVPEHPLITRAEGWHLA